MIQTIKMKNSTLFFRSLCIILLLAGSAHLFAFIANNKNQPTVKNNKKIPLAPTKDTSITHIEKEIPPNEDPLIGFWKVFYDSETPSDRISIIYQIKKEGIAYNAYSIRYEDESGFSQKAEGAKVLTIENLSSKEGKGIYTFTYEKKTHKVNCDIKIIDKSTFQLSYIYFGYGDVETWKKL